MQMFGRKSSQPTADPKFGFIADDVKRQRELAQQALDEAKRLDAEIQNENYGPRKIRLEESKQKWLEIAKSLAENATNTATSANTTISTISTWYR